MRPFRNYILELSEVEDDTFNPFTFSGKIMKSLKNKEITEQEFDGLSKELEYVCKKHNISLTI